MRSGGSTFALAQTTDGEDNWPFNGLIPLRYGVILADPPWRYENYSKKGEGKGAAGQYACLSDADLAALPVNMLAAPACALVMWGVFPMMDKALALMAAWGFTYKSGGAWAKQSSTGRAWAFGTGYIFRAAAEFYIVGTIGSPKVRSRSVRNLIVAPTRGHSRKPDQLHADIETLYDGPYCELFARAERPGWDCWGDQVGKFAVDALAAE